MFKQVEGDLPKEAEEAEGGVWCGLTEGTNGKKQKAEGAKGPIQV